MEPSTAAVNIALTSTSLPLLPVSPGTTRLARWGFGPLPTEHLRGHSSLRHTSLRHTVYLILGVSGSTVSWWASTLFQNLILLLIIFNVGLIIVDTEPTWDTKPGTPFSFFYIHFELASVVIFTVEYLLRFWACVEAPNVERRLKWAATPLAVIDLASLVPFYTDLLIPQSTKFRGATMLRMLRTFSLLRMERTLPGFGRLALVLSRKSEELLITIFIAVIMLILSSSIMYYAENPDGAPTGHGGFTSISASMWWAVAAFTTTGYGDMVPHSAFGRIFGGVLAVLGVGFFALPAGILGSGFVEIMEQERRLAGGEHAPAPSHDASGVSHITNTMAVGSEAHVGLRPLLATAAGNSMILDVATLQQLSAALHAGQITLATAIVDERLKVLGQGIQ